MAPGTMLLPVTHSPLLVPTFALNPLGPLAPAVRLSPAWAAIYPGADLDVSLVPSFPPQTFFCSRLQMIQLPSPFRNPLCGLGQTAFEGVSDKFGGGGKVS